LQDLVGKRLKLDYPDRSKVCPLANRCNHSFESVGERRAAIALKNPPSGASKFLLEKGTEVAAQLEQPAGERREEERRHAREDLQRPGSHATHWTRAADAASNEVETLRAELKAARGEAEAAREKAEVEAKARGEAESSAVRSWLP